MKQWILILLLLLGWSTSPAMHPIQEPKVQRQFKPGLAERYDGRNFNYEGGAVPQHANPKEKTREQNRQWQGPNFLNNIPLQAINILLVLFLIAGVGVLAYSLMKDGGGRLFSRRSKVQMNTPQGLSEQELIATDFHTLIRKAEAAQDYRLAIRYFYLLLLKQLSLKKLIVLGDDRTNADYVQQLAQHRLSNSFGYASYLYNYIWYGQFGLAQEAYAKAKSNFEQLVNSLEHE